METWFHVDGKEYQSKKTSFDFLYREDWRGLDS
jgi:hypothetical protein